MRTPVRLLLIVAPVVFLLGLWMGLKKPGWSPRVGNRDLQTVRVLCPEGVFSTNLLEHLRKREGLDLLVTQTDQPQEYFRKIYQNLANFDVVCAASHHLSGPRMKELFAPLPLSAEWRGRRLHPDFRSLPSDRNLERFWPLGWRVLLPTVAQTQLDRWMSAHHQFVFFLEEDFREVLHLYRGKNLLREEWLQPEHTDPLTTVLGSTNPTWQNVTRTGLEVLLHQEEFTSSDPLQVLYVDHVLWESLDEALQSRWSWGLNDLPGNLQVMGLLLPHAADPQPLEVLIRALARPATSSLLAHESGWASTSLAGELEGPVSADFLRTIPLTQFQMVSGLDPSGVFWERIVSSSQPEATELEK